MQISTKISVAPTSSVANFVAIKCATKADKVAQSHTHDVGTLTWTKAISRASLESVAALPSLRYLVRMLHPQGSQSGGAKFTASAQLKPTAVFPLSAKIDTSSKYRST